ncbi:MAG: hypothetical protein OXI83_12960, partial [Gemmatimonadota bacterium]|nr:hypothetical protein [Gemmatimonadota bacterium]
WMKEGDDTAAAIASSTDPPFATHAVLVLSAGLIILGGIFPETVLDLAYGSVEGLRLLVAGASQALVP